MNSRINQTGGSPTPWPLRYFNANPGKESGCCGCSQEGGSPTPLPLRWFDPNAGLTPTASTYSGCGGGCGCAGLVPLGQEGGAPWVKLNNPAGQGGADCFCDHPDFTNMLYRGTCARQRAAGQCQYEISNLQCLPAMYPVAQVPGTPKSAHDLMTQQRSATPAASGEGEAAGEGEQTGGGCGGGGAFGAPFFNNTFGCAKGAPGVPGLSYRFNECGLETGVNFYRV